VTDARRFLVCVAEQAGSGEPTEWRREPLRVKCVVMPPEMEDRARSALEDRVTSQSGSVGVGASEVAILAGGPPRQPPPQRARPWSGPVRHRRHTFRI